MLDRAGVHSRPSSSNVSSNSTNTNTNAHNPASHSAGSASSLSGALAHGVGCSAVVNGAGPGLSLDDVEVLLGARGADFHAVCAAADTLRAHVHGDEVGGSPMNRPANPHRLMMSAVC